MKTNPLFILALLCTLVQGAWAQTCVSTDDELRAAITNDGANITVTADINLSNSTLSIPEGTTVTIDLGGHTLDRGLTSRDYDHGGQVITVRENATLYLSNGTLKGGWGGNGGGIVNEGGTANLSNVTITGCVGDDRGGGIVNYGTLTIDGCTITGNTAKANGGAGIWNDGSATLNMQGTNTIKDNWKPNGIRSNLYLKNGTLINITGSLADSKVFVDMETLGTFTSGYSTYNDGHPAGFFTADKQSITGMRLVAGEAQLNNAIPEGGVYYIERSWNETAKRVEAAYHTLEENQYITLTGSDDDTYLDPGWYVVKGSDVVYDDFLYMNGGGEYHLILCDGASLKAEFFIVNSPNVLHIHGQANDTGKMISTYVYNFVAHKCAGIGGTDDNANGPIFIHGGDIDVHATLSSAGIGGGGYASQGGAITIYGGTVRAQGGYEPGGSAGSGSGGGAGIGGGRNGDGGIVNIYGGSVYATGKGSTSGAAGIGSGSYAESSGTISIYGGYVEAKGYDGAAGIGGGQGTNGADVTIHGGTVKAEGKTEGPGIGAGKNDDNSITYAGTLTVTGGKVYAYGGSQRGAGIGGGWNTNGSNVTISGGYVYAEGGKYAAGIGSGCEYISGGERHGGTLTVTGGYVEAHGGEDGAGIGGGEDADGGTVNISGGEVRAYGNDYGAGIGGGENGTGGNVTITGGIVVAQSGGDQRAIGAGYGSDNHGSLTFADNMGVFVTTDLYRSVRENRVKDCRNFAYVKVDQCAHGTVTYTINDAYTHTAHCKYCANAFAAEPHTFVNDVCTLCGAGKTTYTVSIYLPDGETYSTTPITYTMASGETFNLPAAPDNNIPSNLEFAGWLVGTPPDMSDIKTDGTETLLPVGTEYTITSDVSFAARYQYIDISLADNANNGEVLSAYDGKIAQTVTLQGRKLYKDGDWNTLTLPFGLDDLSGTPLQGGTLVELDTEGTYDTDKTGFDPNSGTLYLYFKEATAIEAGKPYLVKWTTTGEDIVNPTFSNVTISNISSDVTSDDGKVSFIGNYSPKTLTGGDASNLYLGSGNQLYWPSSDRTMNAFRGYFHVYLDENGESQARSIKLNLDNITGIEAVQGSSTSEAAEPITRFKVQGEGTAYNLSGQRVTNDYKGIVIKGGKKFFNIKK